MIEAFVGELERESASTRKLLERTPEAKLTWKPHPKSMTLGTLAYHIATLPDEMFKFLSAERVNLETLDLGVPQPTSCDEIISAFEKSLAKSVNELRKWDDKKAMSPWTLTKGSQELMTVPHIGVVRSFLLNHLYHHRGQYTVYLRLLDIPVPSVYGPTADENPFA